MALRAGIKDQICGIRQGSTLAPIRRSQTGKNHCRASKFSGMAKFTIITQHLFLASYGAECYCHSFPTLKTNTQHLFLASYGAECYRHSFPTLKTNTRHLFLASYRAECYRHSFLTLKTNTRQLFSRHTEPNVTTIHFRRWRTSNIYFSVIRSRMLPPFISDAEDKHPTFIFSVIRSRIVVRVCVCVCVCVGGGGVGS